MRRVVITGLGLVSPLGVGVQHCWKRLIAGESGIVSTTTFKDYESAGWNKIPAKVVGKVPEGSISENKWQAEDHFIGSESRRIAKFTQYALAATDEAMKDAGWVAKTEEQQLNSGCTIGSGMGSFDDFYENAINYDKGGYRKVQPLFVPKLLSNMACGNIAMKYNLKGVNHTSATACATGLNCIGDAYNFIMNGYTELMVAGGTEAVIHPLAVSGFARSRSLCVDSNETPELASRPFDKSRSGFVLSEGAGIIVVEELNHALARGVKESDIYAEIIGYGIAGDAHHITAPSKNGNGARRSMEMAIKRSGLKTSDIDYINAHATSTVVGDRAENAAIYDLFSTSNPKVSISSTKSAIGHTLGAAGAVETTFTALAVKENILPPTLNLINPGEVDNEDGENMFIFDYVPKVSKSKQVNYALNNSFGFGGVNSSLCLKKFQP